MIPAEVLFVRIKDDPQGSVGQPLPVRVCLVERDSEAVGHLPEWIPSHVPIPKPDCITDGRNRGVGTLQLIGGHLRGAYGGDLARGLGHVDEKPAEPVQEPLHDVRRYRHRPLRHTGEGNVTQKGEFLSQGLRVGEDMGSKREEQ